MLKLILGRSGSGKTYTIRNMLAEMAKKGEEKLMLIVPEQNSFESEREMLKLLGERNFRKIEIVSFTRMVDLVLRKYGGLAGKRLDDGGRNILMSLALEQVKDNLTLYNSQAESSDMVELMITALKEFKMCALSPQSLIKTAEEIEDETLRSKVTETALIMSAYDALMTQTYLDPLDDLTRLDKALGDNCFFDGYTVMIDEFSGFTVQELNILEKIMKQSKDCYISLCMESLNLNNDMDLFSPVHKTATSVMDLAKRNGIKISTPIELKEQHRFKNNQLKAIEKNIFRNEKVTSAESNDGVVLYNASNIYDEAEFVALSIKKLVIEDKYRYRDFAIIGRNIEGYRGILDTTLEKYGVPYFMDKPQIIDSKPLMSLLLTAFDIIHSGYNSDNIFRYLKTGLSGFSIDEISLLENYVLMWGITGKRWHEEFVANPNGFSEKFEDNDRAELKRINNIREKVLDPLRKFEKSISNATGEKMARASYILLEDVHVSDNLKGFITKLNLSGEFSLAEEQSRLWDLLMSILDQTALVLKDKPIKSQRYAELLRMVINSSELAFIPQSLDEVTIGSIDRMRPAEPRVVFVIGAVEGEFPRIPVQSGVFSDYERRQLIDMGLPMYESLVKLAIQERLLAYMAVASASTKVYISWYSSNVSGDSKLPSSIVRETRKILPNVQLLDEYSFSDIDKVWAEKPMFELCASQWNKNCEFSETLKKYFYDNLAYKSKMDSLERITNEKPAVFNDPEKARNLFGGNIRVSASQIEKYYLCRFQYFCQYGLRAKERKTVSFDALEYGSLMHYVLENIFAQYNAKELHLLGKTELRQAVDKLLEDYVEMKLGGWQDKTSRFRYLFLRLSSTAEFLVDHLAKEFAQSEFVPTDFELNIGPKGDIQPLTIKLPDGDEITVEGKVDRVDIMSKDGKRYVRVVDYKTGAKKFNLSDIIYGLNMQMLIYMAAIWSNGEEKYKGDIVPAGVLYMPSNKPLINSERGTDKAKYENEIDKSLKMNGLILNDPIVISGMEADAKGIYIPVKLKDGKPDNASSVASLAEMGKIVKHIEELIVSMADTLRNGDISAEPTTGEYVACSWCPYSSVCGYEEGNRSKEIKKWKSRNDIMAEISKEEE